MPVTESELTLIPPPVARLLDAAERLVAERGAAHVTLEAVAAEAGVSKGGLLYHFPCKTALLEGMVQRRLSDLEQRTALDLARMWHADGPPPPALRVTARLRAQLELCGTDRAIGAAMLAAAAGNPSLLDPCRRRNREILDEMASLPCGFEQAAVLHLAIDGLLFSELLQVSPFTPAERERVIASIVAAAESCGEPK